MMDIRDGVREAADKIFDSGSVSLISHIDADGITSEAIMSVAIQRLGIPTRTVFVRQLEPATVEAIPTDDSLKIFTDLGSGQQNLIAERGLSEKDTLILDHHVSQPVETQFCEVNALYCGYRKLSAAGVAYMVARELDPANIDLAKIAVVGNVGDMMGRSDMMLTGPAREILEDGVRAGVIRIIKRDLNCFGISSRPIYLCLAYSDDPFLPGITGNPHVALQFLQRLGIELRHPSGRWFSWEEMESDDKHRVISALAHHLVMNGRKTDRLLSENYIFPDEPERPLRNASEFSTLLNACGRWTKPLLGSRICKGDRGNVYSEAERMLTHHRGMIRELLQYIVDIGVTELSHLQYTHVGNMFPDTIVGVGAGMALSRFNRKKPILVMSEMVDNPNMTKISMRANEEMVQCGIDLQKAIVAAAEELGGGSGGGHPIAAGAYIPKELEEKFVESINHHLSS